MFPPLHSPSTSRRWRRLGLPAVEAGLQNLAGFKGENPSRADFDIRARLRIASSSCPFLPDDKVSKSGDLDLLLSLKALFNEVEDGLYDLGHLFLRKPHLL